MTHTVLIVIQSLLAAVFCLVGTMKLVQTRAKVISSGGKWAEDFSASKIKAIGALEVLCGLGLVLPHFLGLPGLVYFLAAVGIAATMAGAFFTHLRRKETPFLIVTSVIFLLAGFVAYLRMPQM